MIISKCWSSYKILKDAWNTTSYNIFSQPSVASSCGLAPRVPRLSIMPDLWEVFDQLPPTTGRRY